MIKKLITLYKIKQAEKKYTQNAGKSNYNTKDIKKFVDKL